MLQFNRKSWEWRFDNYEQWKNKKDLYNPGVKNQPFTVSHDPKVTGEENEEESLWVNFEAIRSSIGATFATLSPSLWKLKIKELQQMVKPTWDKLGLKPKNVKKELDAGGWRMYHEGTSSYTLLDSI